MDNFLIQLFCSCRPLLVWLKQNLLSLNANTASATTLVVVVHLPIPEVDICVCNKQKIEEGLLVFPSEDAITSKETTLFRETFASLSLVCVCLVVAHL